MKDRELKQRIRAAVEHAAPHQLDKILSSCDQQRGEIIHMSENKIAKQGKRKSGLAAIAAVAAALAVCLGGYRMLSGSPKGEAGNASEGIRQMQQVDAIIMLDVNPSLSLSVDSEERIVSADALNEEAKEVLGSMELEGTSLEVAVNAIIGSMLQKGYLGDLQNSILVSVENEDAVRGEQLQKKVSDAVASALQTSSLDAAILSQVVSAGDTALTELAEQYGISLGKAALIQEVIDQAPELTFEDLASMTINEIALLVSSRHLDTESVTQTGTASDKAYIGQEEAVNRAYAHAGVTAEDILRIKAEYDFEDGRMVYEVAFETSEKKYEYEINASTGEILGFEMEDAENGANAENSSGADGKDTDPEDTRPESDAEASDQNYGSYIGETAAEDIALAHAGYQASDTVYIHCYRDYYHGKEQNYHVEFMVGSTRYDYKIDFYSGEILDNYEETYSHHDYHDHHHGSGSGSEDSQTEDASYIGESAALTIVLEHAGILEASLTRQQIQLHDDSNRMVYEIQLRVDKDEYEYEIDAVTGEIVKAQIDLDD